jgi:ATF/CREB family transcription factor
MLAGPTGNSDYFGDSHFRGGFPTPNESSLRTGLTPGGGGSMFPAASPGSQAFLNSLQSGGATPGTLDFHRTALSVAAKAQQTTATTNGQSSTQDTPMTATAPAPQPAAANNQGDSYHDANDAANGLFMLAQANGARNNQFAVPGQPAQSVNTAAANAMAGSTETSPVSRNAKGSIASAEGDMSDDDTKPATRSSNRNKKGANAKAPNNRRKADEPPAKGPANKKVKNSTPEEDSDLDDDDETIKQENGSGRKMTDEEKRKNFLERNRYVPLPLHPSISVYANIRRVAALKCRQRKKQWLASLQAKVEYYTAENEALNSQLGSLREEVMNLKTLLLAHKDCPITQQQGLNGMALANLLGDPNQHAHPYGMGMHNGLPPNSMPPQGFSMPPAPPAGMHRR